MKFRLVGAERSDGRTDGDTNMTKLIVVLRNFAKAPKDGCKYHSHHN